MVSGTFFRVGGVALSESGIKRGGEDIGGRGFERVGLQFQPPFMTGEHLAGGDALGVGGYMHADGAPVVAVANMEEGVDQFVLIDVLAAKIELGVQACNGGKAGWLDGGEAYDIAEYVSA